MIAKLFLRTTVLLALVSNAYALTIEDLVNKDWILQSLRGVPISHEIYQGKKPMVRFFSDLRFTAWAGCNQIAGGYTLTNPDVLVFDKNMIMTKMACQGPQNIEDGFIATLQSVHNVTITGQIMQLLDLDTKVVAEFAQLQS